MSDIVLPYKHQQSAHCESGVVSGLLRYHGLDISEPLIFGLTSALTFAYLPLIKMGGMPLIAYRMPPQHILKGVKKALGVDMKREFFKNPDDGMRALDRHLDEGRVVGFQSAIYWLSYFPADMRFHFNAHNLIVYGKEGDEYLISDPVFEHTVRAPAHELRRSRFAKGILAPRGLIYYPTKIPENPNYDRELITALKKTLRIMHAPLPMIGIRGMNMIASTVEKMGKKGKSNEEGRKFIGHIIRMQEEIGTGGGGFRFMYASFLQKASVILKNDQLYDASRQMSAAGDQWRLFAASAAKMFKANDIQYTSIAQQIRECAAKEEAVYKVMKLAFKG